MNLFKRLPKLFGQLKSDETIVPLAMQASASAFGEDFAILERVLMPHFHNADNAAMRAQNQFRGAQVLLIFGGMLATILGAVQVALGDVAWPGALETVLALALAMIAQRARYQKAQEHYLSSRLKAETLRSEYFLFLGRVGRYADDQLRVQQLGDRVARIQAGEKRA